MTAVNNTLANSTMGTNTTTTNSKCSSNQIDIGGTCTSKAEVSKQIISITQGVMQKEDAKGVRPARRRRQRHRRQEGLGISQEGVPATPDMKFRPGSMAIPMLTTLVLQLQEQGKLSLDDTLSKWFPRVPQRRQGDAADALERHLGLPRLHPGEPALPGGAARGAVPPLDRRRAAAVRVRAADRLRPGRVLPLRAHQLHHPRQRCREDHREVDDRAVAAEVPRSARAHRNEYHEAPGHPFTRTPRVHVGARRLRGVDGMEPVVGPRRRTHHDVDAARHDHAHQGGRHRQAALEGVSERAGRGSVEGPAGCAWADRLRTWGRRRQWVGVAEPGLQRIRGDRRVPAVAADLDRDRQHARPERRGGHEHRHRHLQGTRCVPGPHIATINSSGFGGTIVQFHTSL